MVIRNRGELLDLNDQVNLTVQFKDTAGDPIDVDSFPKISIVQPSGGVLFPPTSVGVSRVSTGKYSFLYSVGYNGPFGIYNDIWSAYIQGFRVESTFSFIVSPTQVQAIGNGEDDHVFLGQDPGFNYSQIAIKNINKLLKALKARLNSDGKSKSDDGYGNVKYKDCSIFSIDTLVSFLAASLSLFNEIPYTTMYTFDDIYFVDQYFEILVRGAVLWALSSHSLIERGREYSITDNGISFSPPTVSEILSTQWNTELTMYNEHLKMIKASMRPHPLGLGVFNMNSGSNPAFRRLRHLRARQII
jgi:hypothetical protein